MSNLIGFANKFYTLLNVRKDEKHFTTERGEHFFVGYTYYYSYIKNISIDLEKVKSLYPNVSIDDSLRGRNRDFSNIVEVFPLDRFIRGYLKGTLICECDDLKNLTWSFRNEYDVERLENIVKALNNIGAVVYENEIYSNQEELDLYLEEIRTIDENKNRIEDTYKRFENGGEIEITFDRNLSSYGTVYIDEIGFKFTDYKILYYREFTYSLPTIKGVGKKIKGKTLLLNVKTSQSAYLLDSESNDPTCLYLLRSFRF